VGGYRVIFDEMGIPDTAYWDQHRDGRLRRYLAREVDIYGCMSNHALNHLFDSLGRRGDLIPGGVNIDQFQVDDPREPVPTVLFSGALDEPRKGLGLLLDAVALLVGEVPDLKVWLSGPGDPEPILRAAPAEAQRLVETLPLGNPEEQCHRYRRAWVTTLPSMSDSFGMVLIESLAAGTPITVLDDAAPPELVTPSIGTIATPGDPASLAEALKGALDLAVQPQTIENCRSFARRFDWESAVAPLLEKLYARS
jgi:phosphatidylinositol alpha-mannosyltransferase